MGYSGVVDLIYPVVVNVVSFDAAVDLDRVAVAGHVGTAEISGDPRFHDIYYDGESHYYIDGTVLDSGIIPVLLVDTDEDKYYKVTESGEWLVHPFIY